MAGAVRDEINAVIAALSDGNAPFSFFRLISLFERYFTDAAPVGSATDASRELMRLRAWPSLSFPPGDIAEVSLQSVDESELRVCLSVTFLGLFGPASPLPPYYTEELMGDDPGQETARDFLDLFNHRLISFVYQSWKKYRYYVRFSPNGNDAFSRYIFSLMGMPRLADGQDSEIDWRKLLPFAGLLGMNSSSPLVFERLFSHYFDVPVRIEEGVARVVLIPEEQQQRTGSRRTSLGIDWLLGERVPDRAGKFRIWIGPVSQDRFHSFLPRGRDRRVLLTLVRNLLRHPLDFDVRVLVDGSEPVSWRLGSDHPGRIGWSVILGKPLTDTGEVALLG
jgi:type VI secretion system protein ImpH